MSIEIQAMNLTDLPLEPGTNKTDEWIFFNPSSTKKRLQTVKLINETYREAYRLEANSQSSPTPAIEERRSLYNRPKSDGIFGIVGHDLDDLGIAKIGVNRIGETIWLDSGMCS
jgi:hypothetical protein